MAKPGGVVRRGSALAAVKAPAKAARMAKEVSLFIAELSQKA